MHYSNVLFPGANGCLASNKIKKFNKKLPIIFFQKAWRNGSFHITLYFKVLFMDSPSRANESLETLQDIKRMMERSSRFISLSGLSGVSAGLGA
jgi:hypothetical protein